MARQCDEFPCIAGVVYDILAGPAKEARWLRVLDLAGAGPVWAHLAKRRPDLAGRLSLTLVARSAAEARAARRLARRVHLRIVVTDSLAYLRSRPQGFDLITAVHLLPSLSADRQKHLLRLARRALAPAGVLLVVQSHPQNPLSHLTAELQRKLGQPATPRGPSETQAPGWTKTTQVAILWISENQLLDLGRSLAGPSCHPLDRKMVLGLARRYAQEAGRRLVIPILDNCFLWRRR